MEILVIGSFMMDMVVRTPRAPEDGETIIGKSFSRFPGGKGANQAVAAARLGGNVTFVGKVGTDQFGDEALITLKNEKINIQYLLRDDELSTGVGFVTLEESGSNRIIVVPGANLNYKIDDLVKIKKMIKNSKVIIAQLEMDLGMTEQAISIASMHNIPVILNPAPAQRLSDDLLSKVTYLTPNETEAEILTGLTITSVEDAAIAGKALLDKGVKNVIITLADKGSLIVNPYGVKHITGYSVKAIDSVAAGDSFNGALAFGIINGKSLEDSVRFANAVGALTVTKEGAIPSLPYLSEVEDFIEKYQSMKI
ncbi:ribokinase [Fredinandcohnia humi]